MNSLPKPKSETYYRWRIFGWHIYLSPRRLKLRDSDHGDSKGKKKVRAARLALTNRTCEGCGRHLAEYGYLWRILPKGAPGRNLLPYVRILCRDCHARANSDGCFNTRLSGEGGAK